MDTKNLVALLSVFIPVMATLLVVVFNAIDTRRLKRTTSELEQYVHRLSLDLDQSIQRLNRVTELTSKITTIRVRLALHIPEGNTVEDGVNLNESNAIAFAEFNAHEAELRALALVIDDDMLKTAVMEAQTSSGTRDEETKFALQRAKSIHKRAYELLEKSIWERKMK